MANKIIYDKLTLKYVIILKSKSLKRNILLGISVIVLVLCIGLFMKNKTDILNNGSINKESVTKELNDNLIGTYIQEGEEYKQTDDIPSSGYEFNEEKSYCKIGEAIQDGATLSYDMDTQTLTVSPITKEGMKCYLYFDEASSASDIIEDAYEENQGMLAYDNTADNNLRYIGANPNNYVYFNCDDYNNPSSSTCELWRIIGIFNENSHGISGEKLVKLIRNSQLGDIEWSYATTNNWSVATLQQQLNDGYLNKIGAYAYTGLKNDTTRNMIANAIWKLGGSNTQFDVTTSMFYERERGTTVFSGSPTTWQGKVALMYPSDYGYATSGGSTTNREACLAKELYNWDSSSYSDCKNNDWIFNSSSQWTLTSVSSDSYDVFIVDMIGVVSGYHSYLLNWFRPSVYLTSDVSISGGDGSMNNPYTFITIK